MKKRLFLNVQFSTTTTLIENFEFMRDVVYSYAFGKEFSLGLTIYDLRFLRYKKQDKRT